MATIDQKLLDRLESKLGISRAQVYARIQHVANKTLLDRHLAAMALAAEQGINIQKYSTPDQRAAIRGSVGGLSAERASTAIERPVQQSQKTKATKYARKPKDNSVFVVLGRNEKLRKSLFEFLRALGLDPKEWSEAILMAKGVNPHVDSVIDTAMGKVQAVVVLFSPDDEARLKEEFCGKEERSTEGKLQGQPRPNVIFEAGLALGRHPEKTLLIQIGKVRGFTDIAGKHLIRLANDFDSRNDFANRMRKLGCKVDTNGSDWTKAGDFAA